MSLRSVIDRVYDDWARNNFGKLNMPEEIMFLRPAVGIAAGDDPYFAFLKEHIGPFHWSPAEAFALQHGAADPASLRVVSLVFPQTDLTKGDQQRAKGFPSDRWMVARGEWEHLMEEFCGKFVDALAAEGIPAVAIDLLPQWRRETSENLGIASSWSHRHAAFAAGMGTFGLSDGFITEYGKAIRLTSFVVRADLPVTDGGGLHRLSVCQYHGGFGVLIQKPLGRNVKHHVDGDPQAVLLCQIHQPVGVLKVKLVLGPVGPAPLHPQLDVPEAVLADVGHIGLPVLRLRRRGPVVLYTKQKFCVFHALYSFFAAQDRDAPPFYPFFSVPVMLPAHSAASTLTISPTYRSWKSFSG